MQPMIAFSFICKCIVLISSTVSTAMTEFVRIALVMPSLANYCFVCNTSYMYVAMSLTTAKVSLRDHQNPSVLISNYW